MTRWRRMWPFETNRHLHYTSVVDWLDGEDIPRDFISHPNAKLRDLYIKQFGELRQKLYDAHVATLPPAEQELIATGNHPSQSHAFADRAEDYLNSCHEFITGLGFDVVSVEVGFYHCDMIVLSVELSPKPKRREAESLPWLFSGFQLKYMGDVSDE